MQERLHSQQSSGLQLGQSVLYFGCRRSDQDYLYGPQLQQWADEGRLTLFTAFSRQQVVPAVHADACTSDTGKVQLEESQQKLSCSCDCESSI